MSEPAHKPYEGYKVYKVFHNEIARSALEEQE